MSRGFVKESDQEELPIIPQRAPLPAGVANYVTPAGLIALRLEREELEAEKAALPTSSEDEHRRSVTVIEGKLALLNERITGARPIDLRKQPAGEVRFGATVTITFLPAENSQRFQIVGVDEADVKRGKLAFTAPIVRAITGLYENEIADFKMGGETRKIRVDEIAYEVG